MKRRLIGPTIITLILTGLLVDRLFFNQSPWSVVNALAKFVSIMGAIFKPLLVPKNLAWLDVFLVPGSMVALAIILLWISIVRAKRAMSLATPNADASVPLAEQAQFSDLRKTVESLTGTEPERKHFRPFPLILKLTFGFGAITIVFAIAACVIVLNKLSPAYERELLRRAQLTTMSLTDLVTRRLATKSANDIANDVEKYAEFRTIAYVYVEDSKGVIIAHAPKDLPRQLKRDFPQSAYRAVNGVNVQYQGQEVYEVADRIGTGNDGFVHLAIWRDKGGVEARIAVVPIALSILSLLVVITGAFVIIVRRLNRPFLDLVERADRISRGDFSVAMSLKPTDEIGDIARSIERMRASLHAVLRRLEQAESTEQPGKLPAGFGE